MRAIRERTNKQIEAVLNPQQLTTFRQLFEQGQQQRPVGDSASRRSPGSLEFSPQPTAGPPKAPGR
jgi:hypothetical protein